MISLLILKQFIFFFQRGVANSYQNTGIASEIWSYGPSVTNFIQLQAIVHWIPYTPQGSHLLVQHFSMWHFTINMKAIYLYVSDRSCQFLPKHRDIFRDFKLWSMSDKLHTPFFNLLVQWIRCTTTMLSFHGTALFHVA